MSTGSTDNPRIWTGADVYAGPTSTTAPTNPTATLNAGFRALGLLSEDGLTESRDEDTTDHYAWGGILVRTTRSKHKRTFVVTALEDNDVVFDLANPGSDTSTSGGVTTRTVHVPSTNRQSFVIQLSDGSTLKRIYIPTGEISAVGEKKYYDAEMAMTELTINVYPDTSGVLYKEFSNDTQTINTGS
jgi:hypothetical protein